MNALLRLIAGGLYRRFWLDRPSVVARKRAEAERDYQEYMQWKADHGFAPDELVPIAVQARIRNLERQTPAQARPSGRRLGRRAPSGR